MSEGEGRSPEALSAVPPDVTIVIPTRERAGYLRIAIHSVLTSAAEAARDGVQTRVLVVDDASPTTATRRLAEELGVDYARISVHDGRNDPAAAIAEGVRRVESRYFSLFGDDDVMLPRFIPRHVAMLEAGADVCSSDFLVVDQDLVPQRDAKLYEAELGDLLDGRMSINDGAMTRTSLAQGLDWDPDREQEILYAIWLELLYRGARFAHLSEATFLYRRHTANVSMALDERDAALRRQIADHYRELVLTRDGVIPPPSHPLVPPPAPRRRRFRPWRRVTDRLGRVTRP